MSAVMPCLNGEPFVTAAVESILRQSRPPDEVVLFDNGSTDSTRDIFEFFAKEHEHVRVVRLQSRCIQPTTPYGTSPLSVVGIIDDLMSGGCSRRSSRNSGRTAKKLSDIAGRGVMPTKVAERVEGLP